MFCSPFLLFEASSSPPVSSRSSLTGLSVFVTQASKCPEGTKPMLLFAGEAFETDGEHRRLKSLLIGEASHRVAQQGQGVPELRPSVLSDFFRGPTVSGVRLAGLEHVLQFTSLDGKIYVRSYRQVEVEMLQQARMSEGRVCV